MDTLTISELIESLETAKYESGGDPETPIVGVYWDGERVVFLQPSECVCDVQGSALSASCKVHALSPEETPSMRLGRESIEANARNNGPRSEPRHCTCEVGMGTYPGDHHERGCRLNPIVCGHSESLYGRCVSCGMTWEQQAEQRGKSVSTSGEVKPTS